MADSTSIADDVAKLSLADAAPEEQQPKQKTSKKKKKSKPADVPDTPSEQDDTNYEADLSPEERKIFEELLSKASELQSSIGIDTNRKNLLRFLRGKKFDMARTLEVMKNYVQTHERLGPVEFTAIAEFLSYGTIQSIPDARDREGRKVLNVFPRYAPEPTEEDELDPTRAMMYMLERDLWDPQTQRVGFLVVLDFHKAPFRMNKNSQKSITDTLQVRSSLLLNKQIEENCYPARVGGTLIVDPPWFFKILFTIARPFLKKKTLDRTKVISRKDLTKYISEDNLHPELGGAHSYSHKKWLKKQHKKHALPLSPKAERNFSRYHQPNR